MLTHGISALFASHTFQSTIKVAIAGGILSLLTSCGSPRPQVVTAPPAETQPSEVEVIKTSADVLTKVSIDASAQAIEQLLIANQLLLDEQQPQKALWLANQLQPLAETTPAQIEIRLIKAKALLALAQPERAFQQLQQISPDTNTLAYYQTLHNVQRERGLQVEALAADLNAFALNPAADVLVAINLWQQISQLSRWQLSQLKALAPPNSDGWLRLVQYANRYGANHSQFAQYLTSWQRQFPSHPGNALIENLLTENANLTVPNNQEIAVLLPLTGRQQAAGVAAQQGVLAAYDATDSHQLHFIDTNTLDFSTLAAQLTELNIDFVIGPLLKEDVDSYLAQLTEPLPTLLLNIPSKSLATTNLVALSMRPEDEAIQAAKTLALRGYQHPMIISHNDSVSERITEAFIQQWQQINANTPSVIQFEKGAKMQQSLQASLEVDLSKARIDDLNRRVKENLKTEARNRRDIDMIYIVGTATQTRLIKPYIDVNTSPFSDIIPVFASSRSHSVSEDKNDARDLSGLTFTEMPWQLPSQQQNSELAQQANKLFPERSDSLSRIFAMGYDSYQLINKIGLMQQARYIQHQGQTGTLKLDSNNILTRSLLWGRYRQDRIQTVAMD